MQSQIRIQVIQLHCHTKEAKSKNYVPKKHKCAGTKSQILHHWKHGSKTLRLVVPCQTIKILRPHTHGDLQEQFRSSNPFIQGWSHFTSHERSREDLESLNLKSDGIIIRRKLLSSSSMEHIIVVNMRAWQKWQGSNLPKKGINKSWEWSVFCNK